MKKSIHITIPDPCHERWDAMSATDKGAFCQSCQKEVIDFSAMTDREVIEYLSSHNTGCGRFRKDQVDTKLAIAEVDNGRWKWRAIVLAILPFISFKVFSFAMPEADQSYKPAIARKETVPSLLPPHQAEIEPVTGTRSLDTLTGEERGYFVRRENKDTQVVADYDTTIELKQVEVFSNSHSFLLGTMGYTVTTVQSQMTTESRRNRFFDIRHPSRREERHSWVRHFFHLD